MTSSVLPVEAAVISLSEAVSTLPAIARSLTHQPCTASLSNINIRHVKNHWFLFGCRRMWLNLGSVA